MAGYTLALSDREIERYRMMAERARAEEAEQWRTAGIVPGARVADVGCGPGAVLVAMAESVGPSGWVDGVDGDPEAVAAAEQAIKQSGVGNAAVRVGAAHATGLEESAYDVVVLRHVLAHNGGQEERIVAHLAALARPGGCVYVVDVDLLAMRVVGGDPDAEDILSRYAEFHRSRGNDPMVGVRLGRLLRGAGLELVEHRGKYLTIDVPPGMRPPLWAARDAMLASGHADSADIERWEAAFARMDTMPERPTLFTSQFTAIGRRT